MSSGDGGMHSSLVEISQGTGTTGGRKVDIALFRCSLCGAAWQRETDAQTLRQSWFVKSHDQ
jgi:hypothetical protein